MSRATPDESHRVLLATAETLDSLRTTCRRPEPHRRTHLARPTAVQCHFGVELPPQTWALARDTALWRLLARESSVPLARSPAWESTRRGSGACPACARW